jgi:hypothetical protein
MISNETINAARCGLRDAIRCVRLYSSVSYEQALTIVTVCSHVHNPPYYYARQINPARFGLQQAVEDVCDFDGRLTKEQALTLLMVVADVEGVPYVKRHDYDISIYDEVRRRFK